MHTHRNPEEHAYHHFISAPKLNNTLEKENKTHKTTRLCLWGSRLAWFRIPAWGMQLHTDRWRSWVQIPATPHFYAIFKQLQGGLFALKSVRELIFHFRNSVSLTISL